MQVVSFKDFSKDENKVWGELYAKQSPLREIQIHPIFSEGLTHLKITDERIPYLEDINQRLYALSGFRGIPVEGLEDAASFFNMLERREFPVGNFIRDARDLSYTPAPDIFHDLYGHLPFLADTAYADFSCELGRRASRYSGDPAKLRMWERLYWFGVEFTLIRTPQGRRIFGAGIASSFSECAYALSSSPEIRPFNLREMLNREYRIDEMQKTLYEIQSPQQLYECLDEVGELME